LCYCFFQPGGEAGEVVHAGPVDLTLKKTRIGLKDWSWVNAGLG